MTALRKFEKLESTGLWREHPEARLREVYVLFRDASLVITGRDEAPLSHWSLSAVERTNPGEHPAIFGTGDELGETLEIDDATMIEAIETVRRALARARPRPGRLRWAITLALVAAIAALAVFWLPDALLRHTLTVVPEPKRLQIGRAVSARMAELTGPRCTAPASAVALARLARRIAPQAPPRIHVLPGGGFSSAHLPGRVVLIESRLIEDADGPEVAAGHILRELLRAEAEDPLAPVLRNAGPFAVFRLLTTGDLDDAALRRHAESLLAKAAIGADGEPDALALLARFEAAGVPSAPYAYARDPSGETVLTLIEADPFRGSQVPALMPDSDWLILQGICGR